MLVKSITVASCIALKMINEDDYCDVIAAAELKMIMN